MPGIDPTIALGFKTPDPTQQLSGLLNVANSAQTLQQNQQKTQQGALNLQQRQGMIDYIKSGDALNPDGSLNQPKLMQNAARFGDTGLQMAKQYGDAHQQVTAASEAWNKLGAQKQQLVGQIVYSLPPNAPPDLVHKTLDAADKQFQGQAGPVLDLARQQYDNAVKQGGAEAGRQTLVSLAKSALAPTEQQTLETPNAVPVDAGNVRYDVNTKPGVPNIAQGGVVPGTSVQVGLPPTQQTVGPNNQPGVIGPHGTPPAAGSVPGGVVSAPAQPPAAQVAPVAPNAAPQAHGAPMSGYLGGSPQAAAPEQLRIMQEERAKYAAQNNQAMVASLDREISRLQGFIPTGAVPGANEAKAGSVQVMNDHWSRINAGAADAPVASALLSTIKELAPGAITGTEAGKRAYWNGLFNALRMGTQATGDLQKDTDMLQKTMAQLNLATPATTDAMRTLVEAGRPHSTMSEGAIKDAASQIEGQIRANMAMRNLLAPDKQYAAATGDTSHYEQKRQVLEPLMDPRIFQYESMPKDERKQFMSKLGAQDRAGLIQKTKKLEALGVFQ